MKNWYVALCVVVLSSCTGLNNPFDEKSPNHAGGDALRQYVGMDSVKIVFETIYYDTVTHMDTLTHVDTLIWVIDTSSGDSIVIRTVTVYDTTIYIDTIKVIEDGGTGTGGKVDTVHIRDTLRVRDTIYIRDTVRIIDPIVPPTTTTSKPVLTTVSIIDHMHESGPEDHRYDYAPICTLFTGEYSTVEIEVNYNLDGCKRYDLFHSQSENNSTAIVEEEHSLFVNTIWPSLYGYSIFEDVTVGNYAYSSNTRCVAPDTSQWSGWNTVYLHVKKK